MGMFDSLLYNNPTALNVGGIGTPPQGLFGALASSSVGRINPQWNPDYPTMPPAGAWPPSPSPSAAPTPGAPMNILPPPGGAQQPQQAPQAQQPGMLDRMGGALGGLYNAAPMLMAMGGATMRGGIGAGLQAGAGPMAQLQQMNLQRAAMTSTYQSLVQSGVPPAQAQAMTLNPELMKTMAPQYMARPEFKQIGVDQTTGQPSYGFVNTNAQTVSPVNAQGAPGAPGAVGGTSGLTGQDYMDALRAQNPGLAARVQGVLDGREAPPPGGSRAPQAQAILNMAAQAEPGFDFTKWTARNSTAKDFASGKSSEMVRSANQTMAHVGDLMESVDALNASSVPFWNVAKNIWTTQTGGAAPNNVMLNAHAVADELSKVFKGGNMSDAEIRTWENGLSPNMSPDQWHGAVGKLMSLLNGSLSALDDKRTRGMATSQVLPPLLNQSSQDTMGRVSQWVRGMPQQPQAQAGAVPAGSYNWTPDKGLH